MAHCYGIGRRQSIDGRSDDCRLGRRRCWQIYVYPVRSGLEATGKLTRISEEDVAGWSGISCSAA